MINHYRTLLLNQTDLGNPNEFICPGFNSITLPAPLQSFYNLLFPVNSSRYYQQFIEYYCENLLYSANQTQFLTSFDPRVTYDINDIGEYFQYNQVSTPTSTTTSFNLITTGTYSVKSTVDYYYDNFSITQVGSTSNVTVQSTVTGIYYNGKITDTRPTAAVTIPITFTGGVSNSFPIGSTGLTAVIVGNGTFTSLSNTQFIFSVQAPFLFDYNTFYNTLFNESTTVNDMLLYGAVDPSSQALWTQHFNSVYSLAGLINSYVFKVNAICPT